MELKEVVRRRRMVRAYRDQPVERARLERVLAVARRVPSAGFSQGHYFVVVTSPDTRQAIAELAGEAVYLEKGFDPWLSSAPVHVVVAVREEDYRHRYRQPDKRGGIEGPVPYWWMDGGAAFLMLLLAAVDEGLAAGFLGAHRLEGLRDLLGIPADVQPLGLVTLGYPASDRRSCSLARGWKELSHVVRWERWSG
ncbi:MAG: nitroreductase family protein [Armatimonadetes bacterium]|nr:nitroreductase family protein [Armatimonadota bacterium]